jgi:anti-anti-sigma factor
MEAEYEEWPGNALSVCLKGRLDTVGVDQVESSVIAAVAAHQGHVAIDLAGVSFLASMGVRLIITLARSQQARGKQLVLFAAPPAVRSTLDMVALDKIIPIVPTRAEALARLAA